MGRYPFTECVNEYVVVERGHISYETYRTTKRRLLQIGRIFHNLKEKGTVGSENPRTITPRDIDAYVGFRKQSGIKSTTVLKDLGYLAKILAYFDNEAVVKFKAKYPAHVPRKYQKRAPSMEDGTVDKILKRAMEISITNWFLMEAYGLVSVAICTGFRPKELRMLSVKNVKVCGGVAEIFAVHVKGEGEYGSERWVTVHPDGVPILIKYLEARKIRLGDGFRANEDALFPPLIKRDGYVSYNRIRVLKKAVEEDLEIEFELRKCRRTFGQRALDEGQDIYNVSLVMGHSTLATTQKYYCDKDQRSASVEMQEFWLANKAKGGV